MPLTFQASHDAFAVYLTPASTSGGGGFPAGYHRLVAAHDNLCLDVYGNTSAAGAAIDQWTCNGQANQQFQFVPGTGGYGELRAQNSGQDVAVSGGSTAQGTPDIVQQPPNTAAGNLWQPVAQSDGSYAVPQPAQRVVPGRAQCRQQSRSAAGSVAVQGRTRHEPGLPGRLTGRERRRCRSGTGG